MTQSPAEEALIEVVLAALADPTRRRILNGLSAAGGGTATTLAENLPITRQAVVKHLAVLHQAGLVAARKLGREMRYSVATSPLEMTARWMSELASEWDRPLKAVKHLAETEAETETEPDTEIESDTEIEAEVEPQVNGAG